MLAGGMRYWIAGSLALAVPNFEWLIIRVVLNSVFCFVVEVVFPVQYFYYDDNYFYNYEFCCVSSDLFFGIIYHNFK